MPGSWDDIRDVECGTLLDTAAWERFTFAWFPLALLGICLDWGEYVLSEWRDAWLNGYYVTFWDGTTGTAWGALPSTAARYMQLAAAAGKK